MRYTLVVIAQPAIEIDNLSKDYAVGFWRKRPRRALDGLTLAVEPGEIFGFLGPNGAGKSTTLKLLMGLIFPTAGAARILGRAIGDVAMHRSIGFLPEQPYFYDYLTARELLDYFARFFAFTSADRAQRVSAMLERVGLTGAALVVSGAGTTRVAHPAWTNGGFNNGTLQTAALSVP